MDTCWSRTEDSLGQYVVARLGHVWKEKAESPTALTEYGAYLLLVLQLVVQLLTVLLPEDPFWTPERNASLNLDRLVVQPANLLALVRPENSTTSAVWLSDNVAPWYWSLLVYTMLTPSAAVKRLDRPGSFLLMSLQVHAVAKAAGRLLALLNAAAACTPVVRANRALSLCRLYLGSFLRKTPGEEEPEVDPDLLVARDLHLHHFAGEVARLHPRSRRYLHGVLDRIRDSAGEEVAEALEAAAVRAGMATTAAFGAEVFLATAGGRGVEEEEAEEEPEEAARRPPDCGRLLMSHLSLFGHLNAALVRLGEAASADKVYEQAVQDVEPAEGEDAATVLLHTPAVAAGSQSLARGGGHAAAA